MIIKNINCDVCSGTNHSPFFKSTEWSNAGRYTLEPQKINKQNIIELIYCHRCGHIRQTPGKENECNYTEISRDTSRQIPEYAIEIINSLPKFNVDKNDLILEIGTNDGSFLNFLRDCGYKNTIGIEPSVDLAKSASSSGHKIINEYFSPQLAKKLKSGYGNIAAVICRHTLEHVPNPAEIMKGIEAIIRPKGLVFIEVPDSEWIISRLAAHEIWDEHIGYFRAGSLKVLLNLAGFKTIRLSRVRFRDTRNLLSWSIYEQNSYTSEEDIAYDNILPEELSLFQKRWDAFSERLASHLSKKSTPVIALGASHIQLNFLNYTKLNDLIDILVDDDPLKANHYIFLGKAIPIISTKDLVNKFKRGTIILSGFPYPHWHEKVTKSLENYDFISIDPELFK